MPRCRLSAQNMLGMLVRSAPTCKQGSVQLQPRIALWRQPPRRRLGRCGVERHPRAGLPAVLLRTERDVGPAQALQLHEAPDAAHGCRQLPSVLHTQQGIPAVGSWGLLSLLGHGKDVGECPAGAGGKGRQAAGW